MSDQDQAYRDRLARGEAVRRELVEAAKAGEFYSVGEQAARLLLEEEEQRRVQAVYQRGVADALDLERRQRQAAVDKEAERYSPEVLDAAQARMAEAEAQGEVDLRDFDQAAQTWRRYAQEAQAEAQRHRLTDATIREMTPEQWATVYDTERGRFKEGYVYEPGEESGYGGINAAAAGLGGTSLDLTRYRP